MADKKSIMVSDELYNAIQQLKPLFKELSWEEVKEDEEVIGILISWFIDSFKEWIENDSHKCKCWEWEEWKCDWDCDCQKNKILLA